LRIPKPLATTLVSYQAKLPYVSSSKRKAAVTVAIDQYAEKALGNRDYFPNKPFGVG